MSEQERQSWLPGFFNSPDASNSERKICKSSVYVLDVHYLMYQVFHALPDIRSECGLPVAAIYGFTQDILRLIDQRSADFVFCAFDTPRESSFRRKLFLDYKANREAMPEDLQSQLKVMRKMLSAMNVPAFACPTFEADDILATVARQAEERDLDCFLVTGDKDCRQLISSKVKMFNIRKNKVFDAECLMGKWGIRPEQVVDFQTLVGDKVDNIQGVPMIGEKTAQQLLLEFGTLDNVMKNLDKIQGAKKRENLSNARSNLEIMRSLVRLVNDVPIEIDWSRSRPEFNQDQIQAICKELSLFRLADKFLQFER